MKLELKNVCKKYGNKFAVHPINLVLEPGIYGILGENGAGKSTLMSLLTDNLKRTSGEILYNGTEILRIGREFRRKIGYMPQQQGFYERMSPNAFLMYMSSLKGISKIDAKKQIKELLEIVNLMDVADKRIERFSGGMKQRVLLAQALLGNPEIIILDEPTAGLDPKERIHIRNFIMELSKDRIILFATHVVGDIECIADKVILLKEGKIIKAQSPLELIESVSNHIFEKPCKKEEIHALKQIYPSGNLLQKKGGLVFRIAGDVMPEEFRVAGEDLNLEDVYMFYLE